MNSDCLIKLICEYFDVSPSQAGKMLSVLGVVQNIIKSIEDKNE